MCTFQHVLYSMLCLLHGAEQDPVFKMKKTHPFVTSGFKVCAARLVYFQLAFLVKGANMLIFVNYGQKSE
jgi:hypothetical protein